ncbi:MAG: CRISPR-associated endonuclease Cas2 [Thalassobaculaceae bacterium]
MATGEMIAVFSYDVSEARRRRRVAAILEAEAVRVQQSVFEARMTRKQIDRLADAIGAELDRGDSLRVYTIAAHGERHCRAIGGAPLPEDQDFWLL